MKGHGGQISTHKQRTKPKGSHGGEMTPCKMKKKKGKDVARLNKI
jgi:hypothetical protein